MPTNRKRVNRAPLPPVEEWMINYLKVGYVTATDYDKKAWEIISWYEFDWPDPGPCANPCLPIAEAWEKSKSKILAEWTSDRPGSRPWGFWYFADPQRDAGQPELAYLESNGLLTKAEKALLNRGVI